MSSQLYNFTDLEKDTLLTFDPYPDGVTIDPSRFKPEVIKAAEQLAEREFIRISSNSDGETHFQLTEQGMKFTRRWDFE